MPRLDEAWLVIKISNAFALTELNRHLQIRDITFVKPLAFRLHAESLVKSQRGLSGITPEVIHVALGQICQNMRNHRAANPLALMIRLGRKLSQPRLMRR